MTRLKDWWFDKLMMYHFNKSLKYDSVHYRTIYNFHMEKSRYYYKRSIGE